MHMFGTGGDSGLGRDYARGDGARERAARGRPRRRTGRSSSRARSFTATRTAWGVTCPRSVTPLARSSCDAGVGQTRCRTSQIRPPPSRGRRSFGVGVSTRRASIFTRGGRCVISPSVGVGVSTRRARRAVVSTSTSGAQPNARPAGRESPDHRAHTRNVRHASARIQGAVRCQRRAQHTISARTWWCAEPRRGSCTRGEYRLRRATMSSRVIQRLSGVNTESRRSSNTSGHSALIVESRAARIA